MKTTGRCPKCDSTRLLEEARITNELMGRPMQVVVYEDRDALVLKGKHTGRLAAWICSDCGYTELYCPDLF